MPTPASRAAADRSTRPRAGVLRRLCRWSAFALLVLLDLVLLAFLLRRPLFEGLVRELAGRELSALLGADVTIGAIGGSWIGSLQVEGIELRGRPGDLLGEVRCMTVLASFSPWALLHGDLSGLRTVRVRAARVAIETTGRPPGNAQEPAVQPAAPVDFGQLAALLPRGAEVDVQDLEFGSGSSRRRGPFHLVLEPGNGARHVKIGHEALFVEADLSLHKGTAPTIAGTVRGAEVAQLAACFAAVPQDLSGGTVYLVAALTLQPLRITTHGVIDGLHAERAELQRSVFSLNLDEERLEVPQATLDLNGLHLQADRFVVPSPLGGRPLALAQVQGEVDLRIDDLEPWRNLMPGEIAALLPMTGRLHGRIDRGLLHIDECRIVAPGTSLVVDRGVLPIDDRGDLAHADLDLGFTLDLPVARHFTIGSTKASATGRITGRLAGSVAAPRLHGTVRLSQSACEYGSTGRFAAAVSFQGGVLEVAEMVADGVILGPGSGASRVQGLVRIALPSGGHPIALTADVHGMAHGALLTAAGLDAATAARVEPFRFAVAGEVAFPPTGLPSGAAKVEVRDLVVASLPAAAIDAELALSAGVLHVGRCHFLAPSVLDLHGDLPLGGNGSLDLVLDAPDQDVAFWTSLLTKEQLTGSLSVNGHARGTLAQPELELSVEGSLTSVGSLLAWWPETLGAKPEPPLQVRLVARQGESCVDVEELVLASSPDSPAAIALKAQGGIPWLCGIGTAPVLRAAAQPFSVTVTAHGPGVPERDLPWRLQTAFAMDAQQTRLDELVFAAGPGALRGSGTLAAGWSQLFTPLAFGDAAVAGRAQLEDLRLETLPSALIGLAAAQGTLRGEVTLAGTLAHAEPIVTLEVSDAQVRVPGAPRLTELSGSIRGNLRRLEVSGMHGKMGAGPVALDATLTSQEPGFGDLDAITVQAHLTGTQALIVNTTTLRVRGDVDVTASGTLGKMKVQGDVALTSGRYAQRITAVPGPDALKSRGGAATGEGLEINLIDPPFGQRVELDLRVRTRRNFEVRTHLFDADLALDMRVLGDASQVRFNGNVSGHTGTLRLPGITMTLRSLLVTFPPDDPFHPKLQLLAEGRRHGYAIQLDLHGSGSIPDFVLTSTPALPAEDLLVLVSTGALPERLREQGARGQAALIGAYLAEELASWYLGDETTEDTKETIFDRIRVETGREISDKGIETVMVEFKLNDRFALQGERDVYEDINGGISIRWRFK